MDQPKTNPESKLLVEVCRGPIVESRHRGHIVAVDGNGKIVARLGDPNTVTFLRSSAKPFQALPLVQSGAADRFGFTEHEIALTCASHNGEKVHTEIVASILRKIGLDSGALKCGIHDPFSKEVVEEFKEKREAFSVLQNNCSGKHSGMLALALHLGAPTDSYDHPDSPVQKAVISVVSQFSGMATEDIAIGTDGCGVPVFGVSLRSMALMFVRLVNPPSEWESVTKIACRRIVDAMRNNPELIGGTKDRLDTEVMRATRGKLISKVGAEGVYTAAVLPSERWPTGLGIALKIEDGENHRARPVAVIETFRQLGILDARSVDELKKYARFLITNHRGDSVGEVRPQFELERHV
jgi:L-asparaginase II